MILNVKGEVLLIHLGPKEYLISRNGLIHRHLILIYLCFRYVEFIKAQQRLSVLYSKARKGAIVSNLKSRYRLLSICVVINVTINICIIVQIVCATPTLKHKMLCIDGFYIKPFLAISITHFTHAYFVSYKSLYTDSKASQNLRIPLFFLTFSFTCSIRKWLDHFPSLFRRIVQTNSKLFSRNRKKKERRGRKREL